MNCRVCNSLNGSKHCYYGAYSVCASCRGFFMRSVQSGLYSGFEAHSTEGCNIDSKSRKSCKKCRFDKCLEVGMKTSYVKTLQDRKDCIQRTHKLLHVEFTSDEGQFLEELSSTFAYQTNLKSFKLYANAIDVFYSHFTARPGYAMTTEEINISNKMDYAILMNSSLALLAFNNKVENCDAYVLAKHNFHRLQCFYLAIIFDATQWYCFKELYQFGLKERQFSTEVELVMSHMEALILNNEDGPSISYESMFSSPWACHAEYEDEHKHIMKRIHNWFWDAAIIANDYDKNVLVLVLLVLLHCTDGISNKLKDAQTVEKIQSQYANLLHKYLAGKSKVNASKLNGQFSRGLMFCHDTNRAYELSLKRLQL